MNGLKRSALVLLTTLAVVGCGAPDAGETGAGGEGDGDAAREAMLARAASLELDTDYVPPPGEPLHHHTSGFAKILCSGVFITGLDVADAAANVGGFTSPFDERRHVVDTVVDFDRQEVRLTLPDGVTRAAKVYGSQGCVTRPIGEDSVFFAPSVVAVELPPAETTPWPMGDVLPDEPFPADVDMEAVARAVETAMGPAEARTEAMVHYTKAQVYSGALRYLRVDLDYPVSERDADAAYLLFEHPLRGSSDKSARGAIELVETGRGIRVYVSIPQLPEYQEDLFKRGLIHKLRAEYGAPVRRAPQPPPDTSDKSSDAPGEAPPAAAP